MMITIGAKLNKKALKSKCLFAEPIIIFGGSPINVAVPPIFEKIISESKYGTGFTCKMRVIDKVTGTTRSTVVTLSKNAEPSAVSKESEIKILIGFPCAPLRL